MAELKRVESAIAATSSGNLTWDSWPHNVSTAMAMAGRRNPLGFAIIRYLADDHQRSMLEVVLILSTQLIKAGMVPHEAHNLALTAFEFWNNRRCPSCRGTGDEAPGRRCKRCGGDGQRPLDEAPIGVVRDAIALLLSAEHWMENQLKRRLTGASFAVESEVKRVVLQPKDQDAFVKLCHGLPHTWSPKESD